MSSEEIIFAAGQIALREQENKEKKVRELIAALKSLEDSCDPVYVPEADFFLPMRLTGAVQTALKSKTGILAELYENGKGTLKKTIEDLRDAEKLDGVRKEVVHAVLVHATPSETSEKRSVNSGQVVPYRSSSSYSPALFRDDKANAALVVSGGVGALLICGGMAAAFALLAKSAVVSTAVMAVATASAGFPPLLIAMLAAGGAAVLITGIVIAAVAIKNYRDQQRMALGAAAFMGMGTGSPAAASYAYQRMGGR